MRGVNRDDCIELVEQRLIRFFTESKLRSAALDPSYLQLWEALERVSRGGSRSRPRLVLMAYAGLGGNAATEAASLATAFELLHTALLVHDDVIDRDLVRRGSPNVAGAYRKHALRKGMNSAEAGHIGASVALLAGDLALAGAYQLLRSLHVSDSVHRALHAVLDQAIFASVGGELLDIEFSADRTMPSIERILSTARYKTAVYTFEAPLQAAAIFAGATEEVRLALERFGHHAGIAYQITDDILGVFGDPSLTGKSTISDLREGKRTILLCHAATKPEWLLVENLVGSTGLTISDAEKIRAVLIKCGSKDFATDLALQHARAACELLDVDGIPSLLREQLSALLYKAITRVKMETSAA
ncbi:polyprenyl synthetase family protein [Glutamicibacter mishrai]|uniref:Polyprenyl synthetase family protein n=1 Tax=Glutamicibacter mishrai TaxID=1775880 RepID=A0A6H0SN68_9MICC|nr:polyprenyl synthetase family protein [Glutamicibacter mishrai]